LRSGNSKHVYLVAYLHEKGFGRATVQRDSPINSSAEIEVVDKALSENMGFACSTFSFQLIEVTR
jgi:hypothetical protein